MDRSCIEMEELASDRNKSSHSDSREYGWAVVVDTQSSSFLVTFIFSVE